jgi:hypothetical protein
VDAELLGAVVFSVMTAAIGVGAFALSSPFSAALVLAPLGAVATTVGWWRRRAARGRELPAPVYLGVLPDAPVLVAGRASALLPTESPLTKTACVYWCLRVVSAEVTGDADGGRMSFETEKKESGLFLIDDGEGKALVWPDGRIRFASGWHESLKGDDFRDMAERLVPEGAMVSVAGRAGSFERMMTEMSQRALELPPDMLKALQTKPELRGLPCFWPRKGDDFRVAEGAPEALLADIGESGETLLYAGLATMGFAVVLVLGVAFRLF